MKAPQIGDSMSKFNPGPGGTSDKRAKLFSTTAKDNPDCISGTNDLKPFQGGKGTPSGPFGLQGKEF